MRRPPASTVIGLILALVLPVIYALVLRPIVFREEVDGPAAAVLPVQASGSIEAVTASLPAVMILVAVGTAAVTEEVLFRSYAIERLTEVTGSRWLAGSVSVAFFTGLHAGSWNVAHLIGVVVPLGVALTLLYLWRRNLIVVIIAHFFVDLPLVVLSILSNG